MIKIYTDGSSRKDNEGGWAFVVSNESKIIYADYEQLEKVTNNNMELLAIIKACIYADKFFKNKPVIIYSDSAYCVNIVNEWMYNWSNNNWQRPHNHEIKNLEFVKYLYNLFSQDFYHCEVQKVAGHSEIFENELADALASNNIIKFNKLINNSEYEIKKEVKELMNDNK